MRSALSWAHDHLRRNTIDEARLTAEMLLAHVLQQDRFRLYLQPDLALDDEQTAAYRDFVSRRGQGAPLQHLLGEVSFMDFPLKVNNQVLIPRFETEELVEQALRRLPEADPEADQPRGRAHFLDAGTGSGAIAIALSRLRPDLRGVASDISPEALAIARQNAEANGVADRLRFVQSDWLESVDGCFDLIVSNPPYIASEEIQTLAPEVRLHDPRLALDGGPDGLTSIRALARQASQKLNAGGWLMIEIGQGQADEVATLLESVGYRAVKVYPDLSGIERIVEAQWEAPPCRG